MMMTSGHQQSGIEWGCEHARANLFLARRRNNPWHGGTGTGFRGGLGAGYTRSLSAGQYHHRRRRSLVRGGYHHGAWQPRRVAPASRDRGGKRQQGAGTASVASVSGSQDDVFVALAEFDSQNPGFNIPLTAGTILAFNEVGDLTDPQLHHPALNCVLPPCFDNVSLVLNDNNGNILAYVLQRSPGAVANVPNANFGDTYREIFLDPNAGSYKRNVFADFLTIPAFTRRGPRSPISNSASISTGPRVWTIWSSAPGPRPARNRSFVSSRPCSTATSSRPTRPRRSSSSTTSPMSGSSKTSLSTALPRRERGGGLAGLPFLVARPAIALLYDRGTREEQADRPVPGRSGCSRELLSSRLPPTCGRRRPSRCFASSTIKPAATSSPPAKASGMN